MAVDDALEPGEGQAAPAIAPRGNTRWNAVFRFGAHIVSILVSLVTIPFLIKHMGVALYGIIGTINTILNVMTIATSALSSTVGRNMTFAIEQGDHPRAQREVSTSVFGLLALFVLALPLLAAGAGFVDHLIKIPDGHVAAARILFGLMTLSFILTTLGGPVSAAMFVRNRLDLYSGVTLARALVMLVAVLGVFSLWQTQYLLVYGLIVLGASLVEFVMRLYFHYRLLPGIRIARRWFDRGTLRGSASLGGWMTLIQIGLILYAQSDMLVANRVLGPAAAGYLAGFAAIPLQLRALASMVQGLFAPNLTAFAARGEMAIFNGYLLRSVRLMTLLMALLVGVYCGAARQVLGLWLGPEFVRYTPAAILLTAHLVINLGVMPLTGSLLAVGKVRALAISTVLIGVLNVTLGIVCAGPLGLGLLGIALAGSIALTLRSVVYTPWLVARICGMSLWGLLRELALGVLAAAVIAAISYGTVTLLHPTRLLTLALCLLIATVLGSLLLLPLGLRTLRQPLV